MRYYIVACCLIASFMLAGCTRSSETKSQPPIPIASGEIIRVVWREQVVEPNGMLTNYIYKAHVVTDGRIAVYEPGMVTVTESDGTKHGVGITMFIEMTFR